MAYYHDWLIHPSTTTQYNSMKKIFYWEKMQESITNKYKNCLSCNINKKGDKKYGKLPQKTLIFQPFYEISVDTIGKFTFTLPNGTILEFYALVIIDTTTKWIEIHPLHSENSLEVSKIVDLQWFCRYPRPQRVIYDQGSEFKKEFIELLDSYGIEKKPITTKNPQSNAINERIHFSINNMIRIMQSEVTDYESWNSLLQSNAFVLRSTFQQNLEASPMEILFNRNTFININHITNWQQLYKNKLKILKKQILKKIKIV